MSRLKRTILVVDDEIEILRVLQRSLGTHGYEVFLANSGEKALEIIKMHFPHLIILALELPGMSGLEVCKWVRAQSDLPIIVISESKKEHDKVLALDLGADDYISKPFGMPEMLARIRVALRRAPRQVPETESPLTIGPLHVDFAQRRVSLNGRMVELTPTEYALLSIFLQNPGKILTRQMLLTQIWGTQQKNKVHSLYVYIGQLRRKIEPDPSHPRFCFTIPGVGYRFSDGADSLAPEEGKSLY